VVPDSVLGEHVGECLREVRLACGLGGADHVAVLVAHQADRRLGLELSGRAVLGFGFGHGWLSSLVVQPQRHRTMVTGAVPRGFSMTSITVSGFLQTGH
jgi:hypothetical protein